MPFPKAMRGANTLVLNESSVKPTVLTEEEV